MNFQALKAECIATSVYASGVYGGRNLKVTLPEVTPQTIEVNAAGGKLELPIWQQLAAMEASISKEGLDKSFLEAIKPEAFDLIINIVQKSVDADGTAAYEHVKVFMRVIPKGIPGMDITPGEQGEKQISFTVLSYQLSVDGTTYLHIDVVKGKCEVNGKDYMSEVNSML